MKKKASSNTIETKVIKKKDPNPFSIESMEFYLSPSGHMTEGMLEKFADEQLKYMVEHDNVINVNYYYINKGISRETYRHWLERSPYLRQRHDQAKNILGVRRGMMMVDRKNNPYPIQHMQHSYDPDWESANRYHAELKSKEEGKGKPISVVYLKEFPKTNEVPEKDTDNRARHLENAERAKARLASIKADKK